MRKIVCALFATCLLLPLKAQVTVSQKETPDAFCVARNSGGAAVYVSPAEHVLVGKVAGLFADDVARVTGYRPDVKVSGKVSTRQPVVVGTLGHNAFIDRLVKQGKVNAKAIRGGWERYVVQVVDKPAKGVDRALVVVGSDKRGAAYGLLSLSEMMGVSPYYWWADVPVEHKAAVWIAGSETSKSPSVKYRGLFINDEDWGLKPWASKTFEAGLGDIGPKTYAKVCELILRLKGNMLGPAMHSCTGAFYTHPESKLVADSFGIVITTSHCEPLLVNNASKKEWDLQRDGDWNYATNAKAVWNKWNGRLSEAARFDNIYTMGMRGLHDAGLRGNLPIDQQVELIGRVIDDQRALLTKHTGKRIEDVPQIFVPYKEALDIYEHGLKVPDDITLVWVDDNYGYMKRVSNPEEQKRKGGSGVYYHLSYLGSPHDYLWICTTPPVLMYEELMKAYRAGADRYWLLNVGDIKPMELGMKTFFDLAWNVDRYDAKTINHHQSEFLGSLFGKAYMPQFQQLLDTYYRLAWSRKPEFMGWEREWDSKEYTKLKDTEFSFQHYGEAQQRLADYRHIAEQVSSVMDEMPNDQRASFFEMVGFPVMAAYQMNRKFLMAQLNHEQFQAGQLAQANWAARQSQQAFDSITSLNHRYNTLLGGKWNGMMDVAPGLCALYQKMPKLQVTDGAGQEPVDLSVGEQSMDSCYVVDLTRYVRKVEQGANKISIVDGLGYDWHVVQLGDHVSAATHAGGMGQGHIDYALPAIDADSVRVTLYTVPFFPAYKGLATKVGVAMDGGDPQVFDNQFKEYGLSWKNQVLRNGAVAHMTFSIDRSKAAHVISLHCGDAGMMVQKVIVDWGGLKKSYLGPNPCNKTR